jgi:hypothetical protein
LGQCCQRILDNLRRKFVFIGKRKNAFTVYTYSCWAAGAMSLSPAIGQDYGDKLWSGHGESRKIWPKDRKENGQDERRKNTHEDRENILLFLFCIFYNGVDDPVAGKMTGKKEKAMIKKKTSQNGKPKVSWAVQEERRKVDR